MKLIVGLGNPGDEYSNTRHNTGFMVIDNYAKYHNININNKKFNGLYAEFVLENEKIILLKPLSYMNLSGGVVSSFVNFFKINIEDILIICDDLDLPFLKCRLKDHGGTGGHNGLKDIEKALKTDNYKRLRIGISNDKERDTKDYVLEKFSKDDLNEFENLYKKTNCLLDDFLTKDFSFLMNKYN